MTPRYALRAQLNAYLHFDRSAPHQFPFPVRIITGDSDPLTPPQNSKNLAQVLKGSILQTLSECEHMPHLEKPDDFLALLQPL